MSLRQAPMRQIALRKRKEVLRDDQAGYEESHASIRASTQPLSGNLASQMYGERLNMMKLLLTAPDAELSEGMGLCVDVAPEAHPDYRVVYVAKWTTHTLAHIQFIPEAERGLPDDQA